MSARERFEAQAAAKRPAAASPAPTVGRTVVYTSRGSADGVYPPLPRAAIITEVSSTVVVDEEAGVAAHVVHVVGVCVLNPTGLFFERGVRFTETPTPGCWSWPVRS